MARHHLASTAANKLRLRQRRLAAGHLREATSTQALELLLSHVASVMGQTCWRATLQDLLNWPKDGP
jgi:hypothetical protein